MAKNYVITAKGRKLDMAGLKASQTKVTPIKNVKNKKPVKVENKNIVNNGPAKLNAIAPSSAPVTKIENKVDLKKEISQLIKSKKDKGEK
jgi:hypothetical protein